MRKLNKLIRNENGSITMFVTLSVLFLIFILVGSYAGYANKFKAQQEQIEQIQENYGKYTSEEEMDKLYIAQTQQEEDDEEDGEGSGSILPTQYQQVEYIEKDVGYNSLGQYINTGITVTKNNYNKIRFIVDEVLKETGTTGWYLNGSANFGKNAIYVGIAKNTFYYGVGNDTSTGVAPSSNQTRYVYDLDVKNDKYTITDYINGEVVVDKSGIAKNGNNFTDEGLPLYLMAYSGENRGHKSQLYGAKIYIDDKLVREYIPCIRKNDNTIRFI